MRDITNGMRDITPPTNGRFVDGRPNRIELAKDNPHVAELMEMRDRAFGARQLYSIAMSIYEARYEHDLPLFSTGKPFGLRVWELTKMQNLEPTVA